MKKKMMSLDEIRRRGIEVLAKKLGPVGMVRFMQQFDTGTGNYTEERRKWLDSMEFDEIANTLSKKK